MAHAQRQPLSGLAIPSEETDFQSVSAPDSGARIFQWEGRTYQALPPATAPLIEKLLLNGLLNQWARRGLLLDPSLTPYRLSDDIPVISQPVLPFPAYPHEWCAAMLKDAALKLLQLAFELAQAGLTLTQAHPRKLLFDISQAHRPLHPRWTDLEAIAPLEAGPWAAAAEFRRSCLTPLRLMEQGQTALAQAQLAADDSVLDQLRMPEEPTLFARWRGALVRWRSKRYNAALPAPHPDPAARIEELHSLKQQVEDILTEPPPALVSLRPAAGLPSLPFRSACRLKQLDLYELMDQLHPATVLDINSQSERHALHAAKLASQVVVFHTHPAHATRLYETARARALAVLPLLVDFTTCAAPERFQCELVLLLDSALRDAVFARSTPADQTIFEMLAARLAALASRWVIVEFNVPVGRDLLNLPAWFTLDHFVNALRTQCATVIVKPSRPNTCFLVIGEKG
jgi:hypothetical protein